MLSIPVSTEEGAPTCLQLLGESFSEEVTDHLVKSCLIPAVPNVKEELEAFREIIEGTEKLQKTLTEIGFLPEWNTKLSDFSGDIEATFADKRIATILSE